MDKMVNCKNTTKIDEIGTNVVRTCLANNVVSECYNTCTVNIKTDKSLLLHKNLKAVSHAVGKNPIRQFMCF